MAFSVVHLRCEAGFVFPRRVRVMSLQKRKLPPGCPKEILHPYCHASTTLRPRTDTRAAAWRLRPCSRDSTRIGSSVGGGGLPQNKKTPAPPLGATAVHRRSPHDQALHELRSVLPSVLPPLKRTNTRQEHTDAPQAPLPLTPQQVEENSSVSSLWKDIRKEVEVLVAAEPEAGRLLHQGVTIHDSLESSLAFMLSTKMGSTMYSPSHLIKLISNAYEADPHMAWCAAADLQAARARDVACDTFIKALLFFKGFQAIQAYRVANWMWRQGRRDVAHHIQGRAASIFNVDIHPAARLGSGLLLDHATGIVIGQTSIVGDNVSLLHRVILGGSGFEIGRRHPTIEDGVLLGAGVNVFGAVTVGENSKIGAGSLVVEDIPANCVAVGVPAKVIKRLDEAPKTSLGSMDQGLEFILDYEI